MGVLTRSARCIIFHKSEANQPARFNGGPFYFKPLFAPYRASSLVGFASLHEAIDAAEDFEEEFGEGAYLPGETAQSPVGVITPLDRMFELEAIPA